MHYNYKNVQLENEVADLNDDTELTLRGRNLTARDMEILVKKLKKNKVS